MADLPGGGRLGIDWGKVRIGVAASDRGTSFAYPVETLPAGRDAVARLAELIELRRPGVVYLGLPLTLAGERGIAARFVLEQAEALLPFLGEAELRLVDERMSTASASRSLGRAGRTSRQQRGVIDQAAATEILQRALDIEDATGHVAGQELEGKSG